MFISITARILLLIQKKIYIIKIKSTPKTLNAFNSLKILRFFHLYQQSRRFHQHFPSFLGHMFFILNFAKFIFHNIWSSVTRLHTDEGKAGQAIFIYICLP